MRKNQHYFRIHHVFSFSFFTLIELLMVIAIIAILSTLLLPSLNKAKETARKISCVSKLKQLGLMTTMYTNTYNENFPYYTAYYDGEYYSWAQLLAFTNDRFTSLIDARNHRPYHYTTSYYNGMLKYWADFMCPSQSRLWCDAPPPPNASNSSFSYTVNIAIFGNYDSSNGWANPMILSRIARPSSNGLLWDSPDIRTKEDTRQSRAEQYEHIWLARDYSGGPCVGFIHNRRCNILYADGHAADSGLAYTGTLPVAYRIGTVHPTRGITGNYIVW